MKNNKSQKRKRRRWVWSWWRTKWSAFKSRNSPMSPMSRKNGPTSNSHLNATHRNLRILEHRWSKSHLPYFLKAGWTRWCRYRLKVRKGYPWQQALARLYNYFAEEWLYVSAVSTGSRSKSVCCVFHRIFLWCRSTQTDRERSIP